jgi:hypothetical protein
MRFQNPTNKTRWSLLKEINHNNNIFNNFNIKKTQQNKLATIKNLSL